MAIYTLTINILSSPLHGSVTPASGSTYDDTGSHTPSVEATPEAGYKFQYWTGALTGRVNPQSLHMTGNLTVNAYFAEDRTQSHNLPDVPTITYDADVLDNRQALNLPDVPTISYDTDILDNRQALNLPDVPTITYDADVLDNRQALNLPTVPVITGVTATCSIATPDIVTVFDSSVPSYTAFTSNLLPTTIGAGDGLYIGHSAKFQRILIDHNVAGAGTYTIQLKYYNGASWVNLTADADSLSNLNIADSFRTYYFTDPSDWAAVAVNGVTKYYIFVSYVSGTTTTTPTAHTVEIGIVSEYTGIVYQLDVAESLSLAESTNLSLQLGKSELLSLAESVNLYLQLNKSELLTLLDLANLSGQTTITVSESLSLSDASNLSLQLSKPESLSLSDTFRVTISQLKTSLLILADNVANFLHLHKFDTLDLIDRVYGAYDLPRIRVIYFNEQIFLTDVATMLIRMRDYDQLTMTEQILKFLRVKKYDTVTLTETILKTITVNFYDSLTLLDQVTLSNLYTMRPQELLKLIDNVALTLKLRKAEQLILQDTLLKTMKLYIQDTLLLEETPEVAHFHPPAMRSRGDMVSRPEQVEEWHDITSIERRRPK